MFNGDLGFIKRIDLKDECVSIEFDGRSIEYDFTEIDEINLAYATTIHKSQGKTFDNVCIYLGWGAFAH